MSSRKWLFILIFSLQACSGPALEEPTSSSSSSSSGGGTSSSSGGKSQQVFDFTSIPDNIENWDMKRCTEPTLTADAPTCVNYRHSLIY